MRSDAPRRGLLSWIVFVVAILGTLTLVAGCVALTYGQTLALL